jgi:Uma2 family endonuclease
MPATAAPSSPFIGLPFSSGISSFHRFKVTEYHRLIDLGILTEDDQLELLDGHLVNKLSRNPDHDTGIDLFREAVSRHIPPGRMLRCQEAVTLCGSEPEPDFAIVRGGPRAFRLNHPTPAEIDLLVEVANSTLDLDQSVKGALYAHAGIAEYWIINLVDRIVEVYTLPSASSPPGYNARTDYAPGQAVPFSLNGTLIASIPVSDLLP